MIKLDDDDQPRQIPEKFRASTDPNDTEAHARLLENDAIQKDLGEKINAPFMANTSLEREMSKAFITIDELTAAGNFSHPDTIERFAAALATVGRYADAAAISVTNKELYQKYYDAVWLPDDEFCDHAAHHYIKEYVWSEKENREMPLIACNWRPCGMMNVIDNPDHVEARLRTEGETREAMPPNLSMAESLAWHHANVKKTK